MSGAPFPPETPDDESDLDGRPGDLGFDPTREHPENDDDSADVASNVHQEFLDAEAIDKIVLANQELDKIDADRRSLTQDRTDLINELLNDVPGLTTDSFKVMRAVHKAAANSTEAGIRMQEIGKSLMRVGERWCQPTLPNT